MINFKKLNEDVNSEKVIDPVQIFDVLPEKSKKYEEYLRDVQSTVLEKWFQEYRNDSKNTVIKMNTGSGKTVVGLLILQSYLNEGKGPGVYVVPDNYLVKQVMKEASDLGIGVTDNPRDNMFIRGEKILITNMHKIINGRSVFGINEIKQDIGCIIIDDAHACFKVAESKFTIRIPNNVSMYDELLNLFSDAIKHQSESRYLEIKDKEKGVQQLIPYWDWNNNLSTVRNLLHSKKDDFEYSNDKSLFFNWPLVKDNLELANCIITGDEILINVDYLPIEVIQSFDDCPHRVFMSATIDDDSIFVSHFNINEDDISYAITPKNANDIGERLILIPQEINPEINEEDLKKYYKYLSNKVNVVVLVPSDYRSKYWSDVADVIIKGNDELIETLEDLKKSHVGLVVLINKYDGIDLPKRACEILVIDGVPDVRSEFDKYEQIVLRGSKETLKNTIQRVEQGMGRGVRSKDDYCVVFLMGNDLVQNLYHGNAKNIFTEATQKQLELSENLFKQVKNLNLEEINKIVNYCLERNTEWIQTSRSVLINIKYNKENNFDNFIVKQRTAFNHAKIRDYRKAYDVIQELVNGQDSDITKGYLKYKLARYQYFIDSAESQQTLLSAKKLNHQLLQPIDGIEYKKIKSDNIPQANKINQFLMSEYSDTNDFVLGMNSIIDRLVFAKKTSEQFEQAILELGQHLGFFSQRPEKEFSKGPDNLWLSKNKGFVIECKNGTTTESINKKDCNQLNGSIEWFSKQYPVIDDFTPILIHNSKKFEYAASPNPNIRIIERDNLDKLKVKLREFTTQVAYNKFDVSIISKLLHVLKLEPMQFVDEYTSSFE
ncbi:DEAD/DEAH box helicase [Halolactibacillus alkaliphilus]|uniref:DEAD/DEAH box helicase n=1 Tax=Halolactibacillus alkaliphilus TaxID=442899 RepID=A0A511X4Z1_9BACI|nr:DEAD/DEAH box helicase family protein [Halolactibacillus alkaliphilus]GEN58014.1 DEAD/DEAH box helicase [Halolactibacillus alkaliphilus]GGN76111.1 DEAD/DEAH box helicase [Halolactibacillus alkaliphilus]SFP11071.1 Replicative superfamily II helicase [Halolactibacillus alkaliphilus]